MVGAIHASGAPAHCELCGRPFGDCMIDAELPGRGYAWGWVCKACSMAEGVRIGWGTGQRYRREGDRWVLAAGGPRASAAVP